MSQKVNEKFEKSASKIREIKDIKTMLNINFSLSGISAIILLKATKFSEQVLKLEDLTGKYKRGRKIKTFYKYQFSYQLNRDFMT